MEQNRPRNQLIRIIKKKCYHFHYSKNPLQKDSPRIHGGRHHAHAPAAAQTVAAAAAVRQLTLATRTCGAGAAAILPAAPPPKVSTRVEDWKHQLVLGLGRA